MTSAPNASRWRTVVDGSSDAALALLLVLLLPFAILLLSAPFVLFGHAVAAIIRLL